MSITSFIEMMGGLALFLYGMQMLGDGLKASASGKMEQLLERLTSNKWKAALLGVLVTGVIQSSGATVVMVVGLVNSGIMTLAQSVGVIIGANVGTTVTAWLLSMSMISGDSALATMLKPSTFAPVLALVGVAILMFAKKDKTRNVTTIIVGFCILMMGMSNMSGAFSGLKDDPRFTSLLVAFAEKPLLGVLVGLVITVILQSSSASIGVMQSMSLSGSLAVGGMFPALMGAEIGSAVTGLLGSIGAKRSARRAALLQLFYCITKASGGLILFYSLNAIIHFGFFNSTVDPIRIAMIHTGFNTCALLVILPFSDILVKVVERVLPVLPEEKGEAKRISILDERFFSTPSFALEQARTATYDMAQYAKEALGLAMDVVFDYSEERATEVERLETKVDNYEDQLESYLVGLSKSTMTNKDSRALSILLHCINDFERITDHALNIMQAAQELHEKGLTFSPKAVSEMKVYGDAVRNIMNMTVLAFQNNDLELAKQIEPLEEVIDGLNIEEKRRHVRRLRKGKCSIEAGFILSDIATDYERIADHCSNVALDLLQRDEDGFETHEYLEKVQVLNSEEFKAMTRIFEAKYKFPGLRKEDETDVSDAAAAADTADKPVKAADNAQDKADKKAAKAAAKAARAAEEAQLTPEELADRAKAKAEKKAAKAERKAAKAEKKKLKEQNTAPADRQDTAKKDEVPGAGVSAAQDEVFTAKAAAGKKEELFTARPAASVPDAIVLSADEAAARAAGIPLSELKAEENRTGDGE